MLTRLRVKNFKNLVDTDVAFGPFTCIAGANGVGKSNLFDAIAFLHDLAECPIVEAAARVRDPGARSGDIRALFAKTATGQATRMSFEADFIVPKSVTDDFGRKAKPSITFLKYKVELCLRVEGSVDRDRIELTNEELTYIQIGTATQQLGFQNSPKFRKSVISGRRYVPLISTDQDVVKLHQDGGSSGRPFNVPARSSPKTILGGINTDSHPTVLAARREMQSWRLLQLEPSALRKPDEYSSDNHVSVSGEHLPASLFRLGDNAAARVANDLSELIPDVKSVSVDQDEGRRLRTLLVTGSDGIAHPARSLSDGTLRFLALAIISADPEAGGLLCLEEPENGIHPSRIKAILNLLQSIAVDPKEEVGEGNPLRQVIITTHSPSVVSELPEDSLIVAQAAKHRGTSIAVFRGLANTWRNRLVDHPMGEVPKGDLLAYLTANPPRAAAKRVRDPGAKRTVRDYAWQQGLFEFMSSTSE